MPICGFYSKTNIVILTCTSDFIPLLERVAELNWWVYSV